MNISRGNLAWLCIVWCFAILVGVVMGLNVPFILLVVGTVLYLIA